MAAGLLAAAAVPALADPGASASGGATASSEVIVKRGDRGEAVRSIQRRLGITADGVFGPLTERAVKRFQSRHGLVPDGIV
jgi:peptidoglycan hydrolase-like protein with peptidoglycan-binding domain